MSKKILLVEGDVDTYFFFALLKVIGLKNVEILPKHGVSKIPFAISQAITDLKKGNIDRLGIIADADHMGIDNGGFAKRWSQLTTPLQNENYTITPQPTVANQGSIFQHTNGLPDVGLWLLPNHFDDGSLENLVLNAVINSQSVNPPITQQNLIDESNYVIANLGTKNIKAFGIHHDAKAKAFTWLAWQKKPRHFIGEVIDYRNIANNLIDTNHPTILALCNWLRTTFP